MLLLGIETSCDDTATAVVRNGRDVLANVATNQDAFHAKYGGIVPEIAGRAHLSVLSAAVEDALDRAKIDFTDLDGIAVTAGPGLIGSLAIGVASAKALAFARNLPLYAVNHLHGHIFSAFLERDDAPKYPFLALLVSGGHSQLVAVEGPVALRVLGRTRDDAAGEAFDKTARLLGLPYPGGPAIDRLARDGDPTRVAFTRNRAAGDGLDLSFSGMKTAVRYYLERPRPIGVSDADVAASFQAAIVDVLIDRLERAWSRAEYDCAVLAGGVAANTALQAAFAAWGRRRRARTIVPAARYCTDNAAMIAACAEMQGEMLRADPLTLSANPGLPFEFAGARSESTRPG